MAPRLFLRRARAGGQLPAGLFPPRPPVRPPLLGLAVREADLAAPVGLAAFDAPAERMADLPPLDPLLVLPRAGLAAAGFLAAGLAVDRFAAVLRLLVAAAFVVPPLPDAVDDVAPPERAEAGAVIFRTTSLAAERNAAPIFAVLSIAASALSAASRPACLAVCRTLELDVSAAAAATSPAASMLRAIGFCASSAARCPASLKAAGILLSPERDFDPPDDDEELLLRDPPPDLPPALPPLDFVFAISVSWPSYD